MKIKFVDENREREVEQVGIATCVSSKHDCSWEFPVNKEYPVYKQESSRGKFFIVFNPNPDSGWYACYDSLDKMEDKDFKFVLKK